jgi:hypothetical protein
LVGTVGLWRRTNSVATGVFVASGTVHRVNGKSLSQCRDSFRTNAAAAAAAAVTEALAPDGLALFVACCTIKTMSLP